jgi:spore germination cell wall hydrolase CwlJ-like protein
LRALELFRSYPREGIGLGIFALIAAGALGAAAQPGPAATLAPEVTTALPPPPPMVVRQIAPEQALQLNAEIPMAQGPNPAAKPFEFRGNSHTKAQALECLALAVYYEAGSQDADGARAVAQVVLNRVRHPAFPGNVCGVVFQGSTRPTGCQFTFTCDGSLARRPDLAGWRRAYLIAQSALSGAVYAPVGLATHYHANYVVPYWASTLAKNAVVGVHIFYRWAGRWGQPPAFNGRYAGTEPTAALLRTAALTAEAANQAAPAEEPGVAEALEKLPGTEALDLDPSMRGDKVVGVRFNVAARKAAEEAPHEDYSKKFDASDNLRWSLSGESVAPDEKPLGKAASTATSSPAVAATAATAAPQR